MVSTQADAAQDAWSKLAAQAQQHGAARADVAWRLKKRGATHHLILDGKTRKFFFVGRAGKQLWADLSVGSKNWKQARIKLRDGAFSTSFEKHARARKAARVDEHCDIKPAVRDEGRQVLANVQQHLGSGHNGLRARLARVARRRKCVDAAGAQRQESRRTTTRFKVIRTSTNKHVVLACGTITRKQHM